MIDLTPELISSIGFPIAVSIYLLTRFEKKLDENTKILQSLIIYLKTKKR